jgi:hypothetical protein
LQEVREQNIPWKKWCPDLSDRQWATVREDYSEDGSSLEYISITMNLVLVLIVGEKMEYWEFLMSVRRLCFALTLWNEEDEHLKERFFGLPGLFGGDTKEITWKMSRSITFI